MTKQMLPILLLAACLPSYAAGETGCVNLPPTHAGYCHGRVDYKVLMSLQDDVEYMIAFDAVDCPADTLAPCQYIIDWRPAGVDNGASGFAAYAAGDAYMFRGDRLVEYHYADNPSYFDTVDNRGVQYRAQFANLLPAFIAEEIAAWKDNGDWHVSVNNDTIVDGRRVVGVTGVLSRDGEIGREVFYIFDDTTGLPIKSRIESNPGQLAEQTIIAEYSYDDADEPVQISDSTLIARYPEVFDAYRDSQFAINSLVGRQLPQIVLPTTTGERYMHRRGETFRAQTIVVLCDVLGEFTPRVVTEVRNALDVVPVNVDVLWAFNTTNADDIDAVLPAPRPGEHILMGAKSLARECGASMLPTMLFVGRDGIVKDYCQGFNNNIKQVVIDKVTH